MASSNPSRTFMTEAALKILSDLFMTPNGRLFAVGSVLCLGSGYYVFEYETDEMVFAYVVLGLGTLMISASMLMATFAKYMESKNKLIIMEMDKELREARMENGEEDRTIYKVDE